MERNIEDLGILLKTYPIGEIHSGVQVLTREHGLISVIAHGARSAKGSLKSVCIPLNMGQCYLYFDPVKESWKLKDFDLIQDHGEVKGDLQKFLHACVWIDLMNRAHGHNTWEYDLTMEALSVLSTCMGEKIPNLTALFFHRYLEQGGLQPDLNFDARAGRPFNHDDWMDLSDSEGGFVLAEPGATSIAPGVRAWLNYSQNKSLQAALDVGIDPGLTWTFIDKLVRLISMHFDTKLPSYFILRQQHGTY